MTDEQKEWYEIEGHTGVFWKEAESELNGYLLGSKNGMEWVEKNKCKLVFTENTKNAVLRIKDKL
jgi:hypothetical protein